MRKFRITGIDRDSGFQTTIVVEAGDPNLAEMEAVRRGVAVRGCELVVDTNDAASTLDQAMEQYRTALYGDRSQPELRRLKPAGSSGATQKPPRSRLWFQIAAGVCAGLIGFTLFMVYVVPAVVSATSSVRSRTAAPRSLPSGAPLLGDWFELVDKSYRITKRGQNYWYVAWKIDVENVSNQPMVMGRVRVQLLDAEGFEIDSDYQYNFRFEPGMNSLTGTAMIDAANAARIAGIQVFTSR